jgi:hypothetical protein
MRVTFEKPSAAGSHLRIQNDVTPVVADMVAWAIMSHPDQVQTLVDAYLTAKAIEEGTRKHVRLTRPSIQTGKIVNDEDALDGLIAGIIIEKAIIHMGAEKNA